MTDPAFSAAIPRRQLDYEEHADGLVTVLVPKFTGRLARRVIVPFLKKPFIRMHLDAVGSTVWLACDGETDVARLAAMVAERFAMEPAAAAERVALFLRRLAGEGAVAFVVPAPGGPA